MLKALIDGENGPVYLVLKKVEDKFRWYSPLPESAFYDSEGFLLNPPPEEDSGVIGETVMEALEEAERSWGCWNFRLTPQSVERLEDEEELRCIKF